MKTDRERTLLERIVIPVDGSELSERIVRQVRRLLVARDAEVIVVRVVEPDDLGEASSQAMDEARRAIEGIVSNLREQGATARGEVLVGDPAERILRFAEEETASLVALSTHGRSGVARWIRGSTAERMLRNARVPLLLANPRATTPKGELRFRRILVPLDGSPRSTAVLPFVGELARLYKSEIVLQHVVEVVSRESRSEQALFTEAEAREHFSKLGRTLDGVKVRVAVDRGAAAARILKRASDGDADLVALATHGRSGSARWLVGSVAEHVLRHAPCPVLAIRTVAATEGTGTRSSNATTLASSPCD